MCWKTEDGGGGQGKRRERNDLTTKNQPEKKNN